MTMTIKELHPVIREGLALHEHFRTLHFTPDEIYARPTVNKFFITIKRGGKEFNAEAGHHDLPVLALVARWREAGDWWNHGATNAQRMEILHGSKAWLNKVSLVMALLDHGFNIRKMDA